MTLGVILAGGESRRFGSPKAFALWRGRPLIEWVLDAQRSVTEAVCIVTRDPGLFESYGTEVLIDAGPGQGPARGIATALARAAELRVDGIWCTPCDAPLADPRLGRRLIGESPDADAVIPRSEGPLGYEPLFGWYSTRLLPTFAASLTTEMNAVHEIVSRLARVVFLAPAEGQSPFIFRNINAPEDLARLEADLTMSNQSEG